MAKKINEESLADAQPEQAGTAFIKTGTDGKPDIASWLNGLRPTRRAAVVYGRADLLAEIDTLAELEMKAPPSQREEIRERAIGLTEQLVASGIRFVFEGRSNSWISARAAELRKEGVTDETELQLHLMVDALVEPEGITVDDLIAIGEAGQAQLDKLAEAANNATMSAPVANPRFLRASSERPKGQA